MLWLLLSQALAGREPVLIRVGGELSLVDQPQPVAPPLPPAPPISLDVEKADIHSVVRLFAEVSGKNFVMADGVKGSVTVRMEDVPWDQALTVILMSNGLVAQDVGEIIVVDTLNK